MKSKTDRITRRRFVRKVAAGTVLAFGMGLTTQRMYAGHISGSFSDIISGSIAICW